MLNNILFKQIDNSSLVVFRIIFGLLCFLESVGAIFTGWIKRTLIEPNFTFSCIGFEWLQPLPGYGMYVYYAIMGMFGLGIMLGYKYRFSAFCFALMWSATYLMQKASYNNHYYLLMLLSWIMLFLPAHRNVSIDAKYTDIRRNYMPQWCRIFIIAQLFIVYTYAAIAKIYPDWLNTTVFESLMQGKKHYFLVGEILQKKTIHYILAYGGILFDGLIVPLLLIKQTRKYAFAISICFHLFNSFVFQIGIFPYLSLAFTLFFFPLEIIHRIFLKKQPFYNSGEIIIPGYYKPLIFVLSTYLLVQIALPLRHHFFQDHVLWTEEGHRLSWRMMLRCKSGFITFWTEDKDTGEREVVKLKTYLSKKQHRIIATKPDVIWQFAQRLKQEFKAQGKNISVYAEGKVSINGRPHQPFIDKHIDIANVPWHHLKHSNWILPSKQLEEPHIN